MHVHRALVDIDVATPDTVEQLLAAEDAAGMLEEEFEQPVFGWAEIDGPAGAGDAALLAVELDIAIGEHGGKPLRTCAPQQAAYPRQKFRNRERFDNVIVGTGGETPDPLAFFAARSEHDDRKLLGFRPGPQAAA